MLYLRPLKIGYLEVQGSFKLDCFRLDLQEGETTASQVGKMRYLKGFTFMNRRPWACAERCGVYKKAPWALLEKQS